jgi:uncharacterized delta-60 repeat protein
MNTPARILTPLIFLFLAACGGGGSDEETAPPPPPPPPAGTLIGSGGGTVTGPSGTSVVIPAGASAAQVRVLIEQTSTGAPTLPTGATSIAPVFAITPHGATFTTPVTVTLPFDPTQVPLGSKPALYKTNAQNQWERVPNAVFGTTTVTAQVTGFSYWAQILPMLVNGRPYYEWEMTKLFGNNLRESDPPAIGRSIDTSLLIFEDIGTAHRDAPVMDADGTVVSPPNGQATVVVSGTDNGADWFLGSEAPLGNRNIDDAIGSRVLFKQTQSWIKRDVDATMSFWILNAFLEVSDRNEVLGRNCPPEHLIGLYCDMISAQIFFTAEAFTVPAAPFTAFDYFYRLGGGVELTGHAGSWASRAHTSAFSQQKLWDIEDFQFDIQTLDGAEAALVTMDLARPIFHEYVIDLSEIAVGQAFTVQFAGLTTTYNRAASGYDGIGTEFPTSARAYLRDPIRQHGVKMNAQGVEPIDTPDPVQKPVAGVRDPGACPAPNPAAGSIQFAAANFVQSESNNPQEIVVTRTGGTQGAVTATFSTRDGSGVNGEDYAGMMTTVFFGDGDDAPRTVTVNAVGDSAHSEPDFTVNLELSQPGFCATIGSPRTAVLTIEDDDPPPPPPSFTVGGTVTGLIGTGLELDDTHFRPIEVGNGAFTMPSPSRSGDPYEVRVTQQPTNPVQACTVVNGSGIMGNANVTNVQVNCAAPVAGGGLDASFGGTGKVAATFGGDESAMLLQPDGKIVIVGGAGDFIVARYNADGTLDGGFGTAGVATTDIAGGSDRAHAVALQSDGKIVVAGYARVGSSDDFAVVRYLTNGTPDPSFGTGGEAAVDLFGLRNRAYAVAIAPDNQILVAGETSLPAGGGDFALVRFSAGGVLDTTFGGTPDGKVTTDIAGGVDNARNIIVESSGTILVTGTITMNGTGVLENFGAARYSANGVLDTTLDTDGKVAIANRSVGDALALQAGKLLIAGNTVVNGDRVFAVMRLNRNGSVDNSFGTQGLTTTAFSTGDDFGRSIALQADGKILVSGQSSNQSNPNFAVARYSANGAPDLTFDGDGQFTVDFFGAGDSAESVAVQADGRIVLSGFAVNGNLVRFGLARVQP